MSLRRCFALFFVLAAATAQAHDARPNYVQITETDLNTFSIMWKVPASMPGNALPYPTMPEGCTADRQPAWQLTGGEYLGQQMFRCDASLSGRKVGIEFPTINPSLSTLYKIRLANGENHLRILKPSETEWTVPDKENRFAVATEYTWLGVEHIWIGIDHLLFVLGLLLIVRGVGLLIKTITAFTLAHSVTLGLAALGFVRVPQAPVEAVIALSILFLATELVKQRRGETGMAERYPWVVALCFGLLHGFGFAGALAEVGLPEHAIPVALLFFNVGVEIGQLLFIAAVLVSGWAIRRATVTVPRWWMRAVAYGIGSLAAFWVFERSTWLVS